MDRQTQSGQYRKRLTGIGALMLMAGGVGLVTVASAGTNVENTSGNIALENLPETITLGCVIRDFKPYFAENGHPDFEYFAGTTTVGLVKDRLDGDGNPESSGDLRGMKIHKEYKDSSGRNINPASYDPELGDVEGTLYDGSNGNGFTSPERFAQWYRDVPGVNLTKTISLTLNRVEGTDRYVFDSTTDTVHGGANGFFPVNDELYGNYKDNRNFHFTTEVNTSFTFKRETGQVFKFTGDDDVWVFIDGQLVIDLGGLHPVREQFLDLDRLEWLEDGMTYSLDIFHAERRWSASNFRIETTLQLRAANLPTSSALFD